MTINISVPEEMHAYITRQCSFGGSVSEYFRSLVRREQRQREIEASRPVEIPRRVNETTVFAEALEQCYKLTAILEREKAAADRQP